MPQNIYRNIYLKGLLFTACLLVAITSCKSLMVIHTTSDNLETNDTTLVDKELTSLITPYKIELDKLMNVEVATLSEDLILEQPESNLGNHIAEIVYWQLQQSGYKNIDFAITNFGGLRVPYVNSGALKVSDAYQIMPFDNYVVSITIQGKDLQQLFDKMAGYNGWPIFKASYTIKEGKAIDIKIDGIPLENEKTYTFGLTDYLANGGDKLSFLKDFKYINTDVYLRDAIVAFWKNQTSQNKSIKVVKDGRVKIADE